MLAVIMRIKVKILSTVLLSWLFNTAVFALTTSTTTSDDYTGTDITIQSVYGMIIGLACWFTRAALILVVIAVVFYGLKFMMSRGNPEKYTEAKKSFKWGLVGVLVVLGTYTIIATIANALGADYTLFIPLDCSGGM